MFIGCFTNHYDENFWGKGDTIEEVVKDIQGQIDDTVSPDSIAFYKAEGVGVTVRTEYIIHE